MTMLLRAAAGKKGGNILQKICSFHRRLLTYSAAITIEYFKTFSAFNSDCLVVSPWHDEIHF